MLMFQGLVGIQGVLLGVSGRRETFDGVAPRSMLLHDRRIRDRISAFRILSWQVYEPQL